MRNVHQYALEIVAKDRENTYALLGVLREIARARSYLEKETDSLHAYCTKVLGFSEGSATRRVNASRLVGDVPESGPQYLDGTLNLTQLSFAQSFFQSEEKHSGMRLSVKNKSEVLEKMMGKSQDESRRVLQREFPDAPIGRESTRIVGDEMEIVLRANADFMATLEAVRARNAHRPEYASIIGTFKDLLDKELTRSHNAGGVSAKKTRSVFSRAGNQCQHVNERGHRCTRRHHLQVDHIVSRARGGTDDIENLQALCRAHNLKKGFR